MILFPLAGMFAQAAFTGAAGQARNLGRWVALASSLMSSLLGIALVATMSSHSPELHAAETYPWIGSYAITYAMGADGVNALPILLISIVCPLLIVAEWDRGKGIRGMHGLLLLIQAALLGTACAQDLFLICFFWAVSAIPFYFLTAIWGGASREMAAFHGIVSAVLGNALFFGAIVLIYFSIDPHTFLLRDLAGGKFAGKTFAFLGGEVSTEGAALLLISLSIALRTPVWPLHGWFVRKAEQAPASVVVASAALGTPISLYLFLKLSYALFPEMISRCAHALVVIGCINVIAGSVCALVQSGLRTLLAFVCLSEVGLILMGIGSLDSAGVVGAEFQLLCLGLALAGFGLFSGILADRGGPSEFRGEGGEPIFGGLVGRAPAMAIVVGIVMASLLGIPGLGGFVGHALLLIGGYTVHPIVLMLAGFSLILATYCLFSMYRSLFLGKASARSNGVADLTLREKAVLLPLVGAIVAFGVYPAPLIELVRPALITLLSTVK